MACRAFLSNRPTRAANPSVGSALSRNALPRPLRAALRPLWLKSGVYESASQNYGDIDLGAATEAFIAKRYAEDARLHAATLRRAATAA